jgi:dUTP pyrophosphatase
MIPYEINFKKLNEKAIIPTFGNNDMDNAGMDFYSTEDVILYARMSALISTGLSWEVDTNLNDFRPTRENDFREDLYKHFKVYLRIASRSGLSVKYRIEVGAGTIDSNYRGEIKILLHNHSPEEYRIQAGDRIAQGIVYVVPNILIQEVKELSETNRSSGGFGSTGK